MDLVNHLENRLLFAVPKKGRLQPPTLSLLEGSDIQFRRSPRLDIALVKNLPLALIFLPAADIPTFVGEGRVDLGITGKDQVAEHDALLAQTRDRTLEESEEREKVREREGKGVNGGGGGRGRENVGVEEVMDLGFGKCKLQVQVPEQGGIERAEELVGRNIVTSFMGLTEDFFRRLEQQQEERGEKEGRRELLRTRIQYVGGSVEAACALGVADGIVDLVESGETMKAAGLKAVETVVASTAVLIKSKRVSNPRLVNLIAMRISGVITAQKYILCHYNIPRSLLPRATQITPGKRAPTITALEDPEWVAVSSMVLKDQTALVMDELTAEGATDILCLGIMNSRTI